MKVVTMRMIQMSWAAVARKVKF